MADIALSPAVPAANPLASELPIAGAQPADPALLGSVPSIFELLLGEQLAAAMTELDTSTEPPADEEVLSPPTPPGTLDPAAALAQLASLANVPVAPARTGPSSPVKETTKPIENRPIASPEPEQVIREELETTTPHAPLQQADGMANPPVHAQTTTEQPRKEEAVQQTTALPDTTFVSNGAPLAETTKAESIPATTSIKLAPAVSAPEWKHEFASRLNVLVSERVHSAQITVNPPELGPVEVRLRVESGEASISFFSGQSLTREAIEGALPRLREMLSESGIALGDCYVGADRGRDPSNPTLQSMTKQASGTLEIASGSEARPSTLRLVDVFA